MKTRASVHRTHRSVAGRERWESLLGAPTARSGRMDKNKTDKSTAKQNGNRERATSKKKTDRKGARERGRAAAAAAASAARRKPKDRAKEKWK